MDEVAIIQDSIRKMEDAAGDICVAIIINPADVARFKALAQEVSGEKIGIINKVCGLELFTSPYVPQGRFVPIPKGGLYEELCGPEGKRWAESLWKGDVHAEP